MATNSEFKLDTVNGTSSMDVYVDNIYVTTYSFQNSTVSQITLSARPNITAISPVNLQDNIRLFRSWNNLLSSTFHLPHQTREIFKESTIKHAHKVDGLFVLNSITVSDIEFVNNTGIITFQPRPQITMNLISFKAWVDFLERFNDIARDF